MNKSEKAHKIFLEVRNDRSLGAQSQYSRDFLNTVLKGNGVVNKKVTSYLMWILEMSEKKFYLSIPSAGVFFLISRDLKSGVTFRYCTTLTEATKRILRVYNECIEIIDLHSIEKGHGSKIISELITLSRNIQLPLSLYAETDELVRYYQQFDFVNHGKLGNNKEYLMLRTLDSDGKV